MLRVIERFGMEYRTSLYNYLVSRIIVICHDLASRYGIAHGDDGDQNSAERANLWPEVVISINFQSNWFSKLVDAGERTIELVPIMIYHLLSNYLILQLYRN